jgi:hypothetical protein
MKKVKSFIAIAFIALYVTACSGSRNSTSGGMNDTQGSGTTTNPGTTNQSGTTNPSSTGNTTDSSQQR